MNKLHITGAALVTAPEIANAKPSQALRGSDLGDMTIIPEADIWIDDGKVQRIVDRRCPEQVEDANVDQMISADFETLDAKGRVVIPGFVDCHTHSLWAGDRTAEWEAKLLGKDYLETLKEGGGILSTVRAVRKSSVEELTENLLEQLWQMIQNGTTTVEVKSGYGLDTESELKMLRAIHLADQQWPGRVFATACIGHAIDPEIPTSEFVAQTIEKTLPAVSAEFPGIAIDGYCEQGSWNLEQTLKLCEAGTEAGHPIRIHADQFHDLGMIPHAVEKSFVSVDHLEATSADHLTQLAKSDTFGVALPCSGFHLDGRYASARKFVDKGGALAIATNNNPGSAPCNSMPMAIALACRNLGLSVSEALNCSTHNASVLLGYAGNRAKQVGRIDVGFRADLVILQSTDFRTLGYQFGGNPAWKVICGGRVV